MMSSTVALTSLQTANIVMDKLKYSIKFDKTQVLTKEVGYLPRLLREVIEIKNKTS